ncbi:putative phosphoglycerate mutase [Mucilaginibacter yixingensis]|uniref:Putative phosphoglycerate mutase n=1 Tax=Mucilaginibacter yixingensis TaxID=1295612 RepID=A0A2T5J9Q8_9SPHI|nr:histidine phosphatase family protein [Mucilaginibacter yixingensis]PTQ96802.1 putative phosphoglycerate mutase [Mucilaginibacter yixingensis]
MIKKILYIVRHGQTDFNKQGIVQGRGINTELNAEGRLQASLFFDAYKDVAFDKIYISELQRTQQSIQQFIDLGIPYQKLAGLDELAWGIYEGQESTPETKAAFLKIMRHWTAGELDEKFEGGESPNEVQARQEKAIEVIMSRPEEKTVLVCMHGRAMRLLLCWLTGVPLSQMEDFPHQNLILYKLAWDGERFEIIDFNNSIHLHNH